MVGTAEGLRTAPSNKLRIRLNSVMNKAGLRGSRAGNALGTLAMVFTCCEWALTDGLELERYTGGNPDASLIGASVAAGMLYKATQGPKTVALAGALGGTMAIAAAAGRQVAPMTMHKFRGILFL